MTRDQVLSLLVGQHGLSADAAELMLSITDRAGFTDFTRAGWWDWEYCIARLPDKDGARTRGYQVSIR